MPKKKPEINKEKGASVKRYDNHGSVLPSHKSEKIVGSDPSPSPGHKGGKGKWHLMK